MVQVVILQERLAIYQLKVSEYLNWEQTKGTIQSTQNHFAINFGLMYECKYYSIKKKKHNQ